MRNGEWRARVTIVIATIAAAALASAQEKRAQPVRSPNQQLERILAAERGDTPEVRALVEGQEPNARDAIHQRTALMWAIFLNDQDAFERFIAAGADVNAKDARGETALTHAAQFSMKYDMTAVAEALVTKGADVNGGSREQGITPLMHAANSNAPGVAQAILSKLDPKDVDARDASGATALARAATVGATEVVALLLEKGAKVDGRDKEDKTPLMHAAGHVFPGTVATVKLLLAKGADPSARDKEGNTALSEAKRSGPPEIVAELSKRRFP